MNIKKLLLAFALFSLPSLAFGQTALTTTTLSNNMSAAALTIQLASVTGISGFGPGITNPTGGTAAGTGNITDIYIDRELMQVVSVNTTAKVVSVLRGQGGSQASAHASGDMVIIGPPGSFYNYDPEGLCIGTGSTPAQYTPWVNQRTSAQWLCSSVTNTWVPGWQNPGISGSPIAVTAAVASAAGQVTPSGPLFHITGALAITGFLIPVGCNATAVGGCSFTVIPDGTFTWTTANNIALAGTAVVNKALTFTWDAKNSKWVPSYIA